MTMLVGSSEPPILKALGTTSSTPEQHGVDFIWPAFDGLVGVQRKEIGDLFSSIGDRLNTELGRARARFKVTWLLIEGSPHWDRDGKLGGLLGSYHPRWTKTAFWNFVTGVQASGVWVAFTESVGETVAWLEGTKRWSEKDTHTSLMTRPNPRGKWGTPKSHEWMVHLVSSFQGVSVGRAEAILETYPQPLAWTVTEEELRRVKGIGPKLARALTQALSGATVPPTTRPLEANPDREGGSS